VNLSPEQQQALASKASRAPPQGRQQVSLTDPESRFLRPDKAGSWLHGGSGGSAIPDRGYAGDGKMPPDNVRWCRWWRSGTTMRGTTGEGDRRFGFLQWTKLAGDEAEGRGLVRAGHN